MWNLVDVDPATVQWAGNRVQQTADLVTMLQQQVESHRTNLSAGWQGPAASAFMSLIAEWQTDFQSILTQVNGIRAGLQDTGVQYNQEEADRQAAALNLRKLLNH
jgi:WXG100 family type VII secretion target